MPAPPSLRNQSFWQALSQAHCATQSRRARGVPAGGADLLAGQPLQQAAAAEPVAAGNQAVRGHNCVLAHCAAHLILQVLPPVALHSAQQPHAQPQGCLLGDRAGEVTSEHWGYPSSSDRGWGREQPGKRTEHSPVPAWLLRRLQPLWQVQSSAAAVLVLVLLRPGSRSETGCPHHLETAAPVLQERLDQGYSRTPGLGRLKS